MKNINEAFAKMGMPLTENAGVNHLLFESNIKRIEKWVDSKDIAILTGFRTTLNDVTNNTFMGSKNVGDAFSREENKKRNDELSDALLALQYGVTKVRGSWLEGFVMQNVPNADEREWQEDSYFVVNLNNDPSFYNNIFKLSEYYNQDAFIYKPLNGTAKEVYTNHREYGENDEFSDEFGVGSRFGKQAERGKFQVGKKNVGMSRVGNQGFVFSDDENLPDDIRKTFADRKKERVERNKKETEIEFDGKENTLIRKDLINERKIMNFMGMQCSLTEKYGVDVPKLTSISNRVKNMLLK
jgi:hypothetical protein